MTQATIKLKLSCSTSLTIPTAEVLRMARRPTIHASNRASA
jgi:hypothetical protein